VRTANPQAQPDSAGANLADDVYLSAHPGSCLRWQPDAPDRLSFAQCTTPHMFEVARSFNGSDNEPCDLTVREYLGDRFDPDSKFSITELSPADRGVQGSRRKLCGLQLPGPDGHPVPFRGQVGGVDQSKVWPPGTCLDIDPKTSRPTDNAVDCTASHAVEVIGAVGLGDQFPDSVPSDADQTAALQDSCAHLAAAYLTPGTVASTGLKVIYHAIGPSSWSAGSRHATCSLGPKQPGPITGRAASHHRETVDENDLTPTESASSASRSEPAHEHPTPPAPETDVTHASQSAETQSAATVSPPPAEGIGSAQEPSQPALGGPGTINRMPAGPQGPAHEVVQIPGLAPVTVPAMPEEPGNAPVPLAP
jgi:hypothetical protein